MSVPSEATCSHPSGIHGPWVIRYDLQMRRYTDCEVCGVRQESAENAALRLTLDQAVGLLRVWEGAAAFNRIPADDGHRVRTRAFLASLDTDCSCGQPKALHAGVPNGDGACEVAQRRALASLDKPGNHGGERG